MLVTDIPALIAKLKAHADRGERFQKPDAFIWIRSQNTLGFKLKLNGVRLIQPHAGA